MTWWQHLLLDSGLSVAFVWSVILAIRYRKQNMQLKDLEVKKSESEVGTHEVDLQKAEICLAYGIMNSQELWIPLISGLKK